MKITSRHRSSAPQASSGYRNRRVGERWYRPWLEFLEQRLTPSNVSTYVPLGDLEFYADFNGSTGPDYSAQSSTQNPIELGYKPTGDPSTNFVPVYTVQGDVSFNNEGSADDLTFTVGDHGVTSFSSAVGVGPDQAIFPVIWTSEASTTINVSQFISSGLNVANTQPVTLKLGNYLSLQINTFGITPPGNDPSDPKPSVTLSGELQIGTSTNFLKLEVPAPNYISIGPEGYSITGGEAEVGGGFTVAGVQFNVDVAVSYTGANATTGAPTTIGLSTDISATTANTAQVAGQTESTSSSPQPNNNTIFTLDLGDSTLPGVLIDLGEKPGLASINATVTGTFNLEGLTANVNEVSFTYVASPEEEFELSGSVGLQVTNALQFSVGFGEPGLVITNGTFQVNSLDFTVGKIDLGGGWQLQQFSFSFQAVDDNYTWKGALGVQTPMKNQLDGNLGLTVHSDGTVSLDDIGFNFAAGEDPVLEIPGTGFFIETLNGDLENLNSLSNLQIYASASLGWGANIQISSTKYNMMLINASIDVTSQGFTLDGGAYFAAQFKTDNGQLDLDANGQPEVTSLLGSATITAEFNWSDLSGSIRANVSLIDGTFTGDILFSVNADLQILVSASINFNVPNGVPLIGGEKLFAADFAFDWNGPTDNGFVAGWVRVLGQDIGISYNISDFNGNSSGFHVIGNSTIQDALEAATEAADGAIGNEPYAYKATITVPPGATGATFSVTLPAEGSDQNLAIVPPNWTQPTPINIQSHPNSTYPPDPQPGDPAWGDFAQGTQNNWVIASTPFDTKTVLGVQVVGDPANPTTALPGNQYEVILNSAVKYATLPQWSAVFSFPTPTVTIKSVAPSSTPNTETVSVAYSVDSAFVPQTSISLYAEYPNDSPFTQDPVITTINRLIGTVYLGATIPTPGATGTITIPWNTTTFFPGGYATWWKRNSTQTTLIRHPSPSVNSATSRQCPLWSRLPSPLDIPATSRTRPSSMANRCR